MERRMQQYTPWRICRRTDPPPSLRRAQKQRPEPVRLSEKSVALQNSNVKQLLLSTVRLTL